MKALLEIVLKNRNGIVPSLDQQIDGFRSEQRRVEAVEKDRSAAALRVSDFAGEDRFPRRIASPVPLEVAVADQLDQFGPQGFRCSAQHEIASGIRGSRFRAKLIAFLVDDAFAAHNDDVLLKVIEILHTLHEQFDIERMFRDQDNVWLAIRRTQSNVAGPPAHDFNDGDTAMAFRCGADALHALRRNQHCRGIAGRGVVDDLVQAE